MTTGEHIITSHQHLWHVDLDGVVQTFIDVVYEDNYGGLHDAIVHVTSQPVDTFGPELMRFDERHVYYTVESIDELVDMIDKADEFGDMTLREVAGVITESQLMTDLVQRFIDTLAPLWNEGYIDSYRDTWDGLQPLFDRGLLRDPRTVMIKTTEQ